MKKKPAAITINLVPKDPFFATIPGRVLKWALSAGRYIVIFTELAVIISFATRFALDRQVTDLNQALANKEAIINSYGPLENNFRIAQSKIASYQQMSQGGNIVETFADLQEITPEGILFNNLIINNDTVIASGTTHSQTAFNLLINNLQLSSKFYEVTVDRVESNQDNSQPGFSFSIRAKTRIVEKTSQAVQPTERENILDRTGGL